MGVALVLESAVVPTLCKIFSGEIPSMNATLVEVEANLIFQLKVQVAWIFINLSMGNAKQQKALVRRGVLKALIRQAKSCDFIGGDFAEIARLTVWALGNFVVDSQASRDLVLNEGVLACLSKVFERMKFEADLRHEIIFFIHNCFVRSYEGKEVKPLPSLTKVIPGLRTLSSVLRMLSDIDVGEVKHDELLN